jgi:hypothetical protein
MSKPATTEQSPDGDDKPTQERLAPDALTPIEVGGRVKGLDPTRYGDWEKNGRCIDF